MASVGRHRMYLSWWYRLSMSSAVCKTDIGFHAPEMWYKYIIFTTFFVVDDIHVLNNHLLSFFPTYSNASPDRMYTDKKIVKRLFSALTPEKNRSGFSSLQTCQIPWEPDRIVKVCSRCFDDQMDHTCTDSDGRSAFLWSALNIICTCCFFSFCCTSIYALAVPSATSPPTYILFLIRSIIPVL